MRALAAAWPRSTKQMRRPWLCSAASATASATVVLPIPPGPTTVTMRRCPRAPSRLEMTSARPMARVPIAGRLCGGTPAQVYVVRDDDEAVELANDSHFGLSGAIFTNDVDRARKLASRLETGSVWINTRSGTSPELPFGGVERSGYGGRALRVRHQGIRQSEDGRRGLCDRAAGRRRHRRDRAAADSPGILSAQYPPGRPSAPANFPLIPPSPHSLPTLSAAARA